VQVMLTPNEKMPGKTDLIVGVEEQLPLKLIASFDDSGADVIGKNHYTAMLQYGNMLGLDHQLTYQFVTTDHSKVYKAHALDYRIPLKWRHYLQINASTSRAKPSFAGGLFNQDAKNNGAGLRYTVPLKGEKTVEWYAALDFKQSNNNLEYGGLQIINNETDLYHVGSGVSAVIRDKWGGWMVGANAMLSPGGLSPRNKTDVLRTARVDASQTYLYGNVSLQRFTTIAKGWDMVTRLHGQISTDNLLGSEQLTAGGTGSVRGYDERVLAGDQGFVFNNELMLPSWKKQLQFFKSKKRPLLDTRVLAFYDVAHLSYKHRHPTDLPFSPMASAGLGLRVGVPGSFGLSFDYGWQITRIPRPQSGTSGGHLKATLAF
jgi:hemolysin activation/secretion protein